MSGYWLKLYTEILDDPKYFRLSDNAKLGMIELMVVARKVCNIESNGELPSIEDICFYTRRSVQWWEDVNNELIKIDFLVLNKDNDTLIIRKFAERQAPVSDAERMRQYRYKKNVTETVQGSLCTSYEDVTKRNVDTEAEADTETDTEKKQIKIAPASYTKYLPSGQFSEKVFITLTGMVTFPAKDADTAINAIESLRPKYSTVPDMVNYLKPFYDDWLERKYSKTNLAWITDWAITGEIPKARSKEEPISRQQKILNKLKEV